MNNKISINNDGKSFLMVKETSPGQFTIIGDSLTINGGNSMYDATKLAMDLHGLGLVDLYGNDGRSDLFYFGATDWAQWNDVVVDLRSSTNTITAPNINRIREAAKYVTFHAYCPGDI